MPDHGILLGHDDWGCSWYLPPHLQHLTTTIWGIAGSGKSTLIARLAIALSRQGRSLLCFDGKDGELAREVAGQVPPKELVYITPGVAIKYGRAFTINVLAGSDPEIAMAATLDLMAKGGGVQYDKTVMSNVNRYLGRSLRLVIGTPEASLGTVRDVLLKPEVRRKFLQAPGPLATSDLIQWWRTQDLKKGQASYKMEDSLNSTEARLDAYLDGRATGAMLSSPRTSLDLGALLDAGKTIVINAAHLDTEQAPLIGNIIICALIAATVNRPPGKPGTKEKPYWTLIADEFPSLSPATLEQSIQRLRSQGLHLITGAQSLSQVADNKGLDAALSGAPVGLWLRADKADRQTLSRRFEADIARNIVKLPRYHAYLEMIEDPDDPEEGVFERIKLLDFDGPRDDAQIDAANKWALTNLTIPLTDLRDTVEGQHHHVDLGPEQPVQRQGSAPRLAEPAKPQPAAGPPDRPPGRFQPPRVGGGRRPGQ